MSSLEKMSICDVKTMGGHCGSYSKRCTDNNDRGAGRAILCLSAAQKGLELLDSVMHFLTLLWVLLPYQVSTTCTTLIRGPDPLAAAYLSSQVGSITCTRITSCPLASSGDTSIMWRE